ncbi:uncharacterized protein [Coffea arabica]|uniref:DUF4283 domain-containing protein n=1 Tax=Coffea arabica TaxID=13443 RepID=A0ABM4W8C3_COFAR
MAALPPGCPHMAIALDGATSHAPKTFAAAVAVSGSAAPDAGSEVGTVSSFRGEPALRMSQEDMLCLAEPFRHALVGRFGFSRPSMDLIRKFFISLGLKGDCSVGLLDQNHVLIRPSLQEDYTRLFVRRLWYVHGSAMTISKWSLDFRANKEIAVAPVWVTFPELPIPFLHKVQLSKLAETLGRLLRIDVATADLRRPSVARILVEMDVSKPPIKRVWIGDEEFDFWQPVVFEGWPAFCTFCTRFGHTDEECFRKHPLLRPPKFVPVAAPLVPANPSASRKEYVPKNLTGAAAFHQQLMQSEGQVALEKRNVQEPITVVPSPEVSLPPLDIVAQAQIEE